MLKSGKPKLQKETYFTEKNTQTQTKAQGYKAYSAYLGDRVYHYLGSLLVELDANLDLRLVETFLGLVMVLIMHRHRNHGLLLSELGGVICSRQPTLRLAQNGSANCCVPRTGTAR